MSKEHYLNRAASAVANYPRLSEDDKRTLTAEVQKIVSDAYDQVPFSENGAAVETPATETPSTEAPVEEPAAETPVTETPTVETPVAETPVTETPSVETPVTETPTVETPVTETPAPVEEGEGQEAVNETPVVETPTTETPVEGGAITPGEPTTPGDPTTTQSGATEVTLDMIWSKLVSLETRITAVEDFQKL